MIALDLTYEFESRGAQVQAVASVECALSPIEGGRRAAVILDYKLSDGDSSPVSRRLSQLGIPFVVYSGYRDVSDKAAVCSIEKPGDIAVIVETVATIVDGRWRAEACC